NTTFSKNWSDGDGGAIYSGPGEVSVSDSTFSENGGNNGGAISSGGTLTVLDSVFRKNAADDWGGGVHNYNLGGVAIASTAFTENTALSGGGLANEGSGLVTVESSTFLKNVAVVSAVLDSGDGGGMHSNSGGEVVVDASTFTENRARGGGGFSNGGGGIVRISSSRFSANTADERGGGILVEGGDVRMVDIDVVGNISKSVGEGGGGIAFAGDKSASVGESAALERSRIRDNKTDGEGGGIDSRGDGPFAISMTTITGNTAATGGALHHVGDAPLLVSRSTLARNVAEHGGGVFVDGDGEAAVENSTVSANRAGQFGGGVLVSSRVSVRHSTVVDNNAPSGGGINNGGGPLIGDGFVFLANSIVANNPTGGNCVGTITSLGGNIENTSTCQLLAGGDQPGTPPLLGPLADNGGPTQTHALLSGSPAQDAAVCTELEPCPEVDQRGIPRPLFDGHDVGAYESELLPGGEPPPPPVGECPKLPNLLIADRDSWISQSSATSNSGSDSSLKVKTQGGSNSRVLVGFPLPPLPEGCTTIASAVLRLNASSAKEGHALAVLQATGGWSESGVTWANQPPTAGPAATTPSGQGVLEWDVTAQLLGSYVSGNHGLLVRDTAENGNGDEQTFNSREKANDGPPELLLVFDDRTPETSIDSGPASPTDQASATVAFSSDEADATFECSLDGAPFSSCSSPHSTGALGEGPHSFEVRATRRIRAVDPTPARHEWTVAIPPETSIAGPASPSSSPAATVTFTSDDPDATFECSANGSTFADCTTPVEYADLGDGEQEVRVRAVDPFGNADPTPAVHRWTVAVPPETSITERPADPSNSTSARVVFGGSDNGTPPSQLAFECSLDGAPFAACSSPATYDGLAEGAHAFEVRAIDLAGHVDGSPASLAWTVDVTPPQTSVDSGPDDPTNSASAQLAFSADEEARFECSLDGAPFAACSSPAGYEGLADGRHTFAVKAIDEAGNADVSAAGHEWTVDTTAPETSIDSGPRDPSNNSSAVFSFAANEQARFECSLDGAPFATCSSPATYAGLGEGRHSLEVRAVDPAGNAEAEPAAHTWTVDLTAPESTIGAAPADPSRLAAAAFEFSADEDGVSFECRLDGEAFGSCSSPRAYEGLAEGRHGFEVRAVDAAGNVEPAAALHEWTIDLTAP
ncbi:MAG TPA: DNRLRE domain-containing protein, partial [Gaiellaceae bacterium]|nr:DNRLRE domain-containing protein [Gaiellaceae bacterium]